MNGLNYYIIASIIITVLISLLFLILLLISRLNKIFEKKLEDRYTPIIDKLLFAILFNKEPVHKVIQSNIYQSCYHHKNFQKTLLENIVKLHAQYEGEYNVRLEDFYHQSGLIKISFLKLKAKEWDKQCEGIRELSEMNIKAAVSDIRKCIWHDHNTLKLEALLGLVRLKGLEGLDILNQYDQPINDWIQLSLLFELGNSDLTVVKNFFDFLNSKNETLVIFGLRLIAKFNQIENIDQIWELEFSDASQRVKKQAMVTLAKLPALSVYNKFKA